ncbi:hypothetical protein [Granulicella tundricola]|uniref:Uncharacterized protein n=1 Tax=Granulicella tundricola (strain ATCC BAA-1859 / DSM 23138 / MP5ACTX9) TaxID=1198114 RepID=E8X3U7_GRATM|nr:hypothetical protein [Granulicella tundricola]ADW69375.1 hypothetical protein AciX9_2338 [Granulicella tundricola MP5ACTX9]
MFKGLVSLVGFLWVATKGSRLRPWRSEYLRWRVETYSGKTAGSLRIRDFLGLFFSERRQMTRFVRWMGEVRGLAEGKGE